MLSQKHHKIRRRRFTSLRSLYFQLIYSRWCNGTHILSMYIMYIKYYYMNYLVKIMKYYNGVQFNRT